MTNLTNLTELYSFKGSYPYPLPDDMSSYNMSDFVLAGPAPVLAPGEVLEWDRSRWQVRGPNESEQALEIHYRRAQRNQLLANCDWTQLADATVDASAWAVYRQALRDVTKQPGWPWTIDWPMLSV